MLLRLLLPTAAAVLLGACTTLPHPLQGQFNPVTPQQAVSPEAVGQSVRWGGRIIETLPEQEQTCFQLLALPLNSMGRPFERQPDASQGRFIACRAGFYDPEVFKPGRDVTFIGNVDGKQNVQIGEYDYTLPRLKADVLYLWPESQEPQMRPYPWGPYPGPYFGPWPGPHRVGWYGWR